MREHSRYLMLIVLALVPPSLPAEEKLEGHYIIGGAMDTNGSVSSGNERLYMRIFGDSAAHIYTAMKAKELLDACSGNKYKSINGLVCYEVAPGSTYECGFSINLETGAIGTGNIGAC